MMPMPRFQEIFEQMKHVDDPDVIERARSNPALEIALELSRPVNWRGSGVKAADALSLAADSAIPVVWVPAARVLRRLADASAGDRHNVLIAHEREVLEQCTEALQECRDEWVADERFLVSRAIEAFGAGHHEAAMALAVAVGEPLALWASEPRVRVFESREERDAWPKKKRQIGKYRLADAEFTALGDPASMLALDVLRAALIAPVARFFTPFWANPGEPLPNTVSRHAVVHQPTPEHFSRLNALLAVMLCTSILRDQQAWCEEVRMEDGDE
jgi:hypothetical protein